MKQGVGKFVKNACKAGAGAAAAYYLLGDIIYGFILTRKGMESPLVMKFACPNGKEDDYLKYLNSVIEEGVKWFNETDKENLVIPSTDYNKKLHANYIKADRETDRCAIVIHGYTSYPDYMGTYVKKYIEAGYDVLTPSLRGHYESEEQRITMGWKDRLDIIDWINYLVEKNPHVKIVIHGVSMGAATTMMTLGEHLPENVKVAVSDCGFSSVWDMFRSQIVDSMHLPEFPVLSCFNAANKAFSGFGFKEASCVEQLKKSVTPTIFVHGEADDFVPPAMLDVVYDACPTEKEKFTVPKATHARSVAADPELYWGKIFEFITKYM